MTKRLSPADFRADLSDVEIGAIVVEEQNSSMHDRQPLGTCFEVSPKSVD